MTNRQGRPRTWNHVNGRDTTEAEYSLSLTAQRLRTEFDAMPPKKQQETVALVERCIADERPTSSNSAETRRRPSQFWQSESTA